MENKEQKAVELLKEIVNWWDKWNNSNNPTDMEDPPIKEARELLLQFSDR